MEIVKTLCQMCSRLCGVNVYLSNGRIVKTEGMPEHPCNKGGLCPKGLAIPEYEYSPQRLTHPLMRKGERGEGKWQQITWHEALEVTANRLGQIKEQYGASAIFFYRGQGSGWGSPWTHHKRFMNALGSPNYGSHSHLCYVPKIMGQVYTVGKSLLPDYEESRCIVLWGYNPFHTALPNLGRRILDAKQRGAKLVVIDPVFTELAAKADLFVRPRPGTDGALALGMLNIIIKKGWYDTEFVEKWTYGFDRFAGMVKEYPPTKVAEITWVPEDTIREAAEVYVSNRPALIEMGNGIEQHTNSVQTSRAITCLVAICGNVDRPGGNVQAPPSPLAYMARPELLPKDVKSVDKHPLYARIWHVPGPDMTDAIVTGDPYPIRAMIVQAGDPVLSLSDSGRMRKALRKLDFLVVHDLFMTATAELADIALPAASFLEENLACVYRFGLSPASNAQMFALRRKVVEPPGECHSDMQFIFELARKMGLGQYFPWRTVEEAMDEEMKPVGITLKDLQEHPEGIMKTLSASEFYGRYRRDGFDTGTKKAELYSELFKQYGYDPLPRYVEPGESPISRPDLAREYPLICGAGIKPISFTHNQFRTVSVLKDIFPEPWLEIHRQTAKELAIEDGDQVAVESPRGQIRVKAKLTEGVDPRAVFLPHGWGQPYAYGGADNILTPDSPRCPLSASTSNRAFLCRVSKV